VRRVEEILLIAGLSWRNVWRNTRRSFLTFLTIVAGCTLILFMRSLQNGGYEQMIEDSIAPVTGHMQIHEKGYRKNLTLEYAFKNDSSMIEAIRQIDGIMGISPRIYTGGLLIFKDSSAGSEIYAVDPECEKKITTLHNYILPGGRYLEAGDIRSIVLGNKLAENLGAKTGDTVSILSQGFDGSIAADSFIVRGIFRSPNAGYNRGLALIPLAQGNETFSMNNFISAYVIRADETSSVDNLEGEIKKITREELEVVTWDRIMPEVLQFIAMDRVSSHIFVFILYMIVAFGILNTIQMSVFERIRELGIMLSIGTSPVRIFSMVLIESFIISVIGISAGLLCGWALSFYFTIYPIDFSGYQAEMEIYGMSTLVYYAKIKSYDFIVTASIILFLSLTFTAFPAGRAAKLNPVRAIRHL
jgi:ABC-type lipoprotein release transport system permease subunit